MELKVFPKPAVAGVLEKGYIEARLHTDGETNIDRIREVQRLLAQSLANPIYVTADPTTEERLGKFEGATFTAEDEDEFVAFLRGPVEEKRRRRLAEEL